MQHRWQETTRQSQQGSSRRAGPRRVGRQLRSHGGGGTYAPNGAREGEKYKGSTREARGVLTRLASRRTAEPSAQCQPALAPRAPRCCCVSSVRAVYIYDSARSHASARPLRRCWHGSCMAICHAHKNRNICWREQARRALLRE